MLDDLELWRFGWAPGNYLQTCRKCVVKHVAAKRSWHCQPCAKEARYRFELEDNFPMICDEKWKFTDA